MRHFLRRLFATWTEFAAYLVFLSVCFTGVANASWMWIVIGGMTLFILAWPRWRDLVEKAGRIDAEYRELGTMALTRAGLIGLALRLYGNAHVVPLVLGAKFLLDSCYLTGAFVFGYAARRFWFG